MEQQHDHDELRDAPILRSSQGQDPFLVPDGFFDRFPTTVQERLNSPTGIRSRVMRLISDMPMGWRLAGSIAVIAALALGGSRLMRPTANADVLAHQPTVIIAPDELEMQGMDGTELLASIENAPGLMADVGSGLAIDEMTAYLELQDLPLELLIDEP